VVVVPAEEKCAKARFFRDWAETWPRVRAGGRLLLSPWRLVEDVPPRLRQFERWLRALAARKGMDFASAETGVPALPPEAAPGICPRGANGIGLAFSSDTSPSRPRWVT
jgi:hypothetical protein